jgi:hypothetical protein
MVRRIGALAAACALAVTGVAWAAQAGTYSGSTSQHGGSITLKISKGKIVHVTFADGTGHGSGCSQYGTPQPQFPVSFKTHMAIAKSGKFSGTASPRDQEVFTLSGRVSAGKITGSFTDKIPIGQLTSHPFTCSSATVRYTAKRASHP